MCSICPSGFYRDGTLNTNCPCRACGAATCPANQYVRLYCVEYANHVCATCGTCGIGQEVSVACGGSSNVQCRDCPAGTYRDQTVANTQTSCAACTICSTTRRERRVGCSASVNEQCPQCDAGSIVVLGATTDSCQACTNGKYARASDNTCATCRECTRTEQQKSGCSTSADRVCEPCGNNKYTLAQNAETCAGCIEGYFNTGAGSCATCAGSSCGEGNYRTCSFDLQAGGVRTCTSCQGQQEAPNCEAGYGVSTRCDGQGTTMVTCAACGIGKHRPAGTALVGKIQTCMPCETGYYKTAVGSGACSVCSNKPASNAQYVTWGSLLPSGNTCPWECNAGFTRSGGTCESCQPGKYRTTSQNVQTEGQVNTCNDCSTCTQQSLPGTIGNYMTEECDATRDRVCTLCRTSCATGQYIQAYCNRTHDMQCLPCATTCAAGSYRSRTLCTGSTLADTQLAACQTCETSCPAGAYLKGTCPGSGYDNTECLTCSTGIGCATSHYEGGCSGTTDTFCIPYTTCGAGFYLADEGFDRDGTCRQCSSCNGLTTLRTCSARDDAVCRGSTSCGNGLNCELLTASNESALFCDFSEGASKAKCGLCPPGYASDGQYCTECPRGYTCDRVGRPVCRGQCGPEYRSECVSEFGLDYAKCRTKCELLPETRKPWRGSFVLAGDEDCATYFLCTPGYYKNFSTGGTVTCEPCLASMLPDGGQWVTDGLSVEDDASCLWECEPERYAPSSDGLACVAKPNRDAQRLRNQAGSWRSASGGGVCGMGRTSQEGTAIAPEECLACQPLVPDVTRWRDRTDQCEFECVRPTDARRGSRCVPERRACSGEGLASCVPQTFPWNRAGYRKLPGWMAPVVSTLQLSSVPAYPLVTSQPYGIKSRHKVTPQAGATQRAIEGALCSHTTGWVGGHHYLFGALCNQSFLVYLNLSSSERGLGVLIGNGTRGWRDGFRTQALFESELYVAGTGDGTLFVLDRWNCLLREVVVWDRPGSYLTRVHTLWGNTEKLALAVPEAKCYGSGSLAWPRRFWPLWNDWLAFGDEDGLWQFHTGTRELLSIVKEEVGSFEVDRLLAVGMASVHAVLLVFRDGTVWEMHANEEACPLDTTSLAGGACTVECRWLDTANRPSQYVDLTTGQCKPCTTPVCGRGQVLQACTPTADALCRACAAAPNETYAIAGTCDAGARKPTPPCRPGWYLAGDGLYCEACPAFTATRYDGATRREQCKCVDGMVRQAGLGCVADGPFERFDRTVCVAGTCRLPRNARARLDDAEPCGWTCNAGFYRDTLAGFLDKCRLCLTGLGRTSGDNDEPWSCE